MAQSFPTIPSTDNYRLGTGIVYFKETGGTAFRDLGECPSLIYTPAVTTKDHYSHRGKSRKKDKSRITQVGAVVKFILTEVTGENLAFFFLSASEAGTGGGLVLRGLSKLNFEGTLKFIGYNEAGRQVDWTGKVSFKPAGDFQFIDDSDEYNGITVEADVLEDENGDYGVVHDRGVGTGSEPSA